MRYLPLVLAFLIFLAGGPASALEKADLSIVAATGQKFTFTVEIARTPEQQQRGLMFRKEMAPDAGMIFPQESDRTMAFWMHNTYIPLDLLFIEADGRISHIVPDAKPMDDTNLPSGGPIRAVLELNGGTAARLGIHVGDRVQFPGLGDAH